MLNPNYFTDGALKISFIISLDSHHINHANSKIFVRPNYPEFGIEVRYVNKVMREVSVIYARLIYQFKFKYQTVFSARFVKQDENILVLDETKLFFNLIINHNITETDIDRIDIRSQLEHQIQIQRTKKSGWRFYKNI